MARWIAYDSSRGDLNVLYRDPRATSTFTNMGPLPAETTPLQLLDSIMESVQVDSFDYINIRGTELFVMDPPKRAS